MFTDFFNEAQVALHSVRLASQLTRQIQQELVQPAIKKADRSPVTVADYASQALVARILEEAFPTDPLVAEEGSAMLRGPAQAETLRAVSSYVGQEIPHASPQQVCRWIDLGMAEPAQRFWALDPIDGTKGFLRGEQYVVALALIVGGQVVLGALGCPNLDQQLRPDPHGAGIALLALRGQGSWITPLASGQLNRISVSTRSETSEARLLRSVEESHTDSAKMGSFSAALGLEQSAVLMDSQAKYAVLAGAGAELIVRLIPPQEPGYCEYLWDQAAGSIVVEEAGGRVSDLAGRRLDFSTGRRLRNNVGVLATNGLLHERVLQALQAVGADRRPEGP